MQMFSGYKTYIMAALGVLTIVATTLGYFTLEQAEMLLALFGFGGLAALRAAK